jgi:hypothetical protein
MRMTGLCLAVATLVGCGSSTNVSTWVGNWTAAVTEVETCTTGTNTTQLTGAVAIVSGSNDTITTQPVNLCDLTWTVSGNGATLQSGQTCTVPGSQGGTWHATFSTGGLTLSGNTIVVGDSGTGVLVNNGDSINCTYTQAGNFTR